MNIALSIAALLGGAVIATLLGVALGCKWTRRMRNFQTLLGGIAALSAALVAYDGALEGVREARNKLINDRDEARRSAAALAEFVGKDVALQAQRAINSMEARKILVTVPDGQLISSDKPDYLIVHTTPLMKTLLEVLPQLSDRTSDSLLHLVFELEEAQRHIVGTGNDVNNPNRLLLKDKALNELKAIKNSADKMASSAAAEKR